jgi:hypothetical protein
MSLGDWPYEVGGFKLFDNDAALSLDEWPTDPNRNWVHSISVRLFSDDQIRRAVKEAGKTEKVQKLKKEASAKIEKEGKEYLETEEGKKLKEELAAEVTKQIKLELAKEIQA